MTLSEKGEACLETEIQIRVGQCRTLSLPNKYRLIKSVRSSTGGEDKDRDWSDTALGQGLPGAS